MGHFVVTSELHREIPTSSGHRPKINRVTLHLTQWHFRRDHPEVAFRVHPENAAALRVDVAYHITHVFFRHPDRRLHDRFQDDRSEVRRSSPESHDAGHPERHLVRIHGVILAVIEGGLNIDHRVTGEWTFFQGLQDPFFNCRYELPRDGATLGGVDELESGAAGERGEFDECNSELSPPSALLLVLSSALVVAVMLSR